MSIDHQVYVGPYVACKVSKAQHTRRERQCLQCHQPRLSAPFCFACGGRVDWVETPIEADAVNEDEVSQALDEVLSPLPGDNPYDGWHFWFVNVPSRWGGRELWFDEDDETLLQEPIWGKLIGDEIDRFEAVFAAELKTLHKLYDKDNVEVRWGVVNMVW